jgi:hypothetical protein
MALGVSSASELAVVQGWAETRATLQAWQRDPGKVVWPWLRVSLVIAVALLVAVWCVARLATPDATPIWLPGINFPAETDDALSVLWRNLLVLALHSLACLAGFIAKSSLPAEAESYTGWWRKVHDRAGPAAIAFVSAATLFSLLTQAFALGSRLSTLSWHYEIPAAELLATLSLHALPELAALFLPLAAWMIAARAGDWHQLMAATFVTTAIALPVVVASAFIEVFVTPRVLVALHFV